MIAMAGSRFLPARAHCRPKSAPGIMLPTLRKDINLMCLMTESMGDRRWLEVEARERVELDLEKVELKLIARTTSK